MKLDGITIAAISIFDFVIILIIVIIVSGIANESNRISSGVIIAKNFYPAEFHKSGDSLYSYPERFLFTIRGEKGVEEVSYTFEVTEDEYNRYRIGDFYER